MSWTTARARSACCSGRRTAEAQSLVVGRMRVIPVQTLLRAGCCCLFLGLGGCSPHFPFLPRTRPPHSSPALVPALHVSVMDPLAAQLACACVAGYAQRRYDVLADVLERALGLPVRLHYTEDLAAHTGQPAPAIPDIVIGSYTRVLYDAERLGVTAQPLALLSDKDGAVALHGIFVVRHADDAQSIDDLEGYRILFGPQDSGEKHYAPLATLEAHGIPVQESPCISPACSSAALAVIEREADAAVISSYALPLLLGCGSVAPGELRRVGETGALPFITVFATSLRAIAMGDRLLAALPAATARRKVLARLESRYGFVPFAPAAARDGARRGCADWPDWRGADRAARMTLGVPFPPRRARLLWRRPLTGLGMSALTLAEGRLFVADKSLDETADIFRCLDADSGKQLWALRYAAAGDMDYSNSPRAAPVAAGQRVVVLGAFGDLHCLDAATGNVLWRKNILREYDVDLPTWGTCSTPLVLGDRVVVSPGAAAASLVALSLHTGEELWRSAGAPAGYGSFIVGTFGGVRQVVGHDAVSLGGWDPASGERLWRVVPPYEGDFNVPTPVAVDGRLLVCTENNGARLYAFAEGGKIRPEPVAQTEVLAPDTSSPVRLETGRVLGVSGGALLGLDAAAGLRVGWEKRDDRFIDYCTLLAGPGTSAALMTLGGELLFIDTGTRGDRALSALNPFADIPLQGREVWSHPVLVGNRLYVRDQLAVYCFLLSSR